MKKDTLKKSIMLDSIENVEKHLISKYIEYKKLNYRTSTILSTYLTSYKENIALKKEISSLEIKSIKDLEILLEQLIPNKDKKFNGAFFTPSYIVDFIIKSLNPKKNDRNLDPSCGSGAFLIGLANYYKRTYKQSIKQTIKENIFGADILSYNINRTKLLLTIYALEYDEILEDSDFNLKTQDSLKSSWNTLFDNIVGNPPYVKFQDLSDLNREFLLDNFKSIKKGSFNLYFAFFELGYNLLVDNGKLGYITPNNYFTSIAGESLRNFFHTKRCINRIMDFASKKVFKVQTYTAITFIQKTEHQKILYDRIDEDQRPIDFINHYKFSPNLYKELNIKKWRLLKSEEQDIINKIETMGTPIGDLFDISAGIATLKDEVYFVDSSLIEDNCYIKKTDKGVFKIEKEITKPVYKISDFKKQSDIVNNTRRIICPYDFTNGSPTIIPEEIFAIKYPLCYKYLLSEKKILLSRDKGKVKYNPFYVWGRSQGLTKFGKKILNPTFSQRPRFLKVTEDISFYTNGYGLFFKEVKDKNLFPEYTNPLGLVENIDIVQKILNSFLMSYYIKRTSVSIEGGYPCFQKNFIEKFTIPLFSGSEINNLRTTNNQSDIDKFLLKKYQINLSEPNLSL